MQNRRRHESFTALPFPIGFARGNPFAAFQLRISRNVRLLFGWTSRQKEPRVKPSRCKRWGNPTTDESEVICIETQTIMPKQFRPRHSTRFKIVEQRSALPYRQSL